MRLLPRAGSSAADAVLVALGLVARLDPTAALAARRVRGAEPPVLLTVVYRRENAATVTALVDDALGGGVRVVLWALDAPHPSLEHLTLGSGPGGRLALHERMRASATTAETADPAGAAGAAEQERWWVVSDDDVRLPRGGVSRLAALAQRGGLDVAGAAHAPGSEWNHSFTLARPLSVARRGLFVETGPVLVLSPRAQQTLLPLPEGSAAGWGMEAYWSSQTQPGLRSGLVDAVAVEHLVPMGGSYDASAEWERCRAFTRRYGVEDVSDLKTTLGTWRPWRSHAPWTGR